MARLLQLLALAGLMHAASAFPKPARTIAPKNPDAPKRATGSPTVLVVGGGLAGLSAALELAERGFKVTIREADTVLGGRLHTYDKDIEGVGRFQVEHGFHGWFHNYHTFKDIRARLDIDQFFRSWGAVHYIFKHYKPEAIESKGPYPLNLLGIVERSPNLHLDNAILSMLSLPDLLGFDYDTVYDRYDNLTFHEWADMRHVDKGFYDIIMQPALSVTVNERATISAAEMLMYMQLYFLSDADADTREVPTKPWSEAVIGPWAERLLSLNATIELSRPVDGLHFVDGRAVGEGAEAFDHTVVATHLSALQLLLNASTTADRQSAEKLREMAAHIAPLETAPPYKVFRGWFSGQLNASCPDVLETPDFSPVNLVAQYHLLEDQSAAWANKTGGSVVEFHLYTWEGEVDVSDDEVWRVIAPTVYSIYPDLEDMELLGKTVGSYHNFPSFCTGSAKHRPQHDLAAQHGIGGLSFGGDWLHTAYPSALMERAVATGREAANDILLAAGVMQVPLLVTSSHGPGIL